MLETKRATPQDYDLKIAYKNAEIYDNMARQQGPEKEALPALAEYELNKIRDTHLEFLSSYIYGSRVLEVGCGFGRLAAKLSAQARQFYGFDISFESVKRAKAFTYSSGSSGASASLCFFVGNVLILPFPDESFDVVVCSEVLEHIPNAACVLSEIRRVLKKAGVLSISVPNAAMAFYPLELFSILRHYGLNRLKKMLARELDWSANEVYDRPFLPGQFIKLISSSGFRVLKYKSALFHLWRRPYSDFLGWLQQRRLFRENTFVFWYSKLDQFLIESGLPIMRRLGTRQFILAKKDENKI